MLAYATVEDNVLMHSRLPCSLVPLRRRLPGARPAAREGADLDARAGEVVEQAGDNGAGVAGVHQRRMDQVHAQHCAHARTITCPSETLLLAMK